MANNEKCPKCGKVHAEEDNFTTEDVLRVANAVGRLLLMGQATGQKVPAQMVAIQMIALHATESFPDSLDIARKIDAEVAAAMVSPTQAPARA